MESLVNSAKSHRPGVQRSQTAQADLSPPNRHHMFRTDTMNTNAPKKHHRDFLHGHVHRHHDEKNTLPTPTLLKPFAPLERSTTTSPRNSTLGSNESIAAPRLSVPSIPPPVKQGRKVRPAALAEERRRGEDRDEELRSSLNELSELAHESTRRLDNLLYTLLEKVVIIRATIGSLQDLSASSRKLHHDFGSEVGELEADIQGQIDGYNSFKEQQARVEDMEARVKSGQNRAKELSGRLEAARMQVEKWAHREQEWQTKTSKRLRIGSGFLISFGVLIVILLLIRHWKHSSIRGQLDMEALKRLLDNTSMPAFAANDLSQIMSSRTTSSTTPSSLRGTSLPSDSRLAGFDEL